MESILNSLRIIKERRPSVTSKKSDRPLSNDRSAKSMKFYVTIPITDVGIIVLEQAVAIDHEKEGDTG